MINRWKQRLKHHFQEVIKTKTSPHSIALGFAIGTLISILPTPGFNLLLGLLVVLIFEKVNKFSLFGAIFFWNPLTTFPVYVTSYTIGNFLFGGSPVVRYDIVILDQIYNFSRRYLVGNFIMAISLSVASYFLVRLIAELYQKRRARHESNPTN